MTNKTEEALKKYGEVVRNHNLWLDTKRKDGARANLEYADLRCVDLHAFKDSNGAIARFDHANLYGADLRHAEAKDLSFKEADLDAAVAKYFNAPGADFSKASLNGTTLNNAILYQANFSSARLSGEGVMTC